MKNLRGYHDVPASLLLHRKLDGLQFSTGGNLVRISLSRRLIGRDVATVTGLLMVFPRVSLKIFRRSCR